MEKLRIVFLSAGRFTHIRAYIDFFKSRGHSVFLIKYDLSDNDFGVDTYDISFGARGDKTFSKWKYLLAGIKIRRLLHQIRPDILHGHYITSAGVISRMSGFSPYILTAHGSDVLASLQNWFWQMVLPKVLENASLVNVVSDDLFSRLAALGVPMGKLFNSTLGLDTERFQFEKKGSEGTAGKPYKLLCTRRLDKVYDPETILDACMLLKDREICFQLTFASDGPMLGTLKQGAIQRGLEQDVKFMGGYDNTELPDLLRLYDVYLSASLWDGTSISLLEAMACGIFPVVSRIAANTALLKDGTTAMMFNCGDANGLAEAICRVIDDARLRDLAVLANRSTVEEKYDRKKNMLELEQKYFEIVKIGKSLKSL